jgi:hypothetical protein
VTRADFFSKPVAPSVEHRAFINVNLLEVVCIVCVSNSARLTLHTKCRICRSLTVFAIGPVFIRLLTRNARGARSSADVELAVVSWAAASLVRTQLAFGALARGGVDDVWCEAIRALNTEA